MFSKVWSAGIGGVDAYPVRVEADVSDGLPQFLLVGYLASEVKEAGDRVRTALKNVGCPLPAKRITVNLAPASVRKAGTRFDLAVAAAVLASIQKIPAENLEGLMIAGELSLSGQVLGIPGVLALTEAAGEAGVKRCIVPAVNAREGALIQKTEVIGVSDLAELIELLRHPEKGIPAAADTGELLERHASEEKEDFSQIRGQKAIRRAAEIAAAGMHNLLMIGPPGSGKTMVARRIPGILPGMTLEESLKITKIYSVAGLLTPEAPLLTRRPFRAPHHTTTAEALAGGGRLPLPGEISLSTGGILFLDELPEFRRSALEILRQPLEEHRICISRTAGTYVFPADFMLVAAMNPCSCGCYPDRNHCSCSPREIARYLGRLSQPLLDRIDLCIQVPKLSYEELQKGEENENSAAIRKRVEEAHRIQKERFGGENACFNSRLGIRDTEYFCRLGIAEKKLLKQAFEKLSLSARAYHRLLRVSRTIADLAGEERVLEEHILEALGYRPLERSEWLRGV